MKHLQIEKEWIDEAKHRQHLREWQEQEAMRRRIALFKFKEKQAFSNEPVDETPYTTGFTYAPPRPASFYKHLGQMRDNAVTSMVNMWKSPVKISMASGILKGMENDEITPLIEEEEEDKPPKDPEEDELL